MKRKEEETPGSVWWLMAERLARWWWRLCKKLALEPHADNLNPLKVRPIKSDSLVNYVINGHSKTCSTKKFDCLTLNCPICRKSTFCDSLASLKFPRNLHNHSTFNNVAVFAQSFSCRRAGAWNMSFVANKSRENEIETPDKKNVLRQQTFNPTNSRA